MTFIDENINEKKNIWFVYDGECPLCKSAAMAFRIKETYGELTLLSAREDKDHWLIREITSRGYDLDEGMVIYQQERFFHGEDALRFMAQFGEKDGLVNRISRGLFWSDTIARVCYPLMRAVRNLLLRIKGVKKINNLKQGADK